MAQFQSEQSFVFTTGKDAPPARQDDDKHLTARHYTIRDICNHASSPWKWLTPSVHSACHVVSATQHEFALTYYQQESNAKKKKRGHAGLSKQTEEITEEPCHS